MLEEQKRLWERCVVFHGHTCGGLAIGFQAALYARKLLDLDFSRDEDVVCICENDACGVDAIQVLLGCSAGKGNLLFHITGKQVFSIFNRKTGKTVRLYLKPVPAVHGNEKMEYLLNTPPEELFQVSGPRLSLPEHARMFGSIPCSRCKELTAEHMIRIQGEERLCPDCFVAYDRFHV